MAEDVKILMLKGEKGDAGVSGDYSTIDNKPSINDVELDGNKSLDDLDIASRTALSAEIASRSEGDNTLQAEIDELESANSSLETRMTTTENDVDVLSARMDTFASLPDGSTSGDAELLDIRVGADGTTYPSAGDAVRSQVSDLKSDLTYIGNTVIGGGSIYEAPTGGKVVACSLVANTQYVMLNLSDSSVFTDVRTKAGASSSSEIIETLNTAEVAPGKYCVLSPTVNADYLFFYCSGAITVQICEKALYDKCYRNDIVLLQDNKANQLDVDKKTGLSIITESDVTFNGNKRIMTADGSEGSNNAFRATKDFIDVAGCDYIEVTLPWSTATSDPTYGCAFYTAEEVFIASFSAKTKAQAGGYFVAVIAVPPTAKYFKTTWWSAQRVTDFSLQGVFSVVLRKSQSLDSRLLTVEQNETDVYYRQADTMPAVESDAFPVIPESLGVYNTIRNARQLTDIVWTPVASMPGLLKVDGVYTQKNFPAGIQQRGIPYSGVHAYDNFVGFNILLDTWQTAVQNPNSVLYTMDVYNATLKRATYYGIVCSKFAQYALGVDGLCTTNEISSMPNLTKVANSGSYDEDDIEIGDILNLYGVHTAVVTGLFKTSAGAINYIEVSEAVTPLCRRVKWSVTDFFTEFAGYDLYRYDLIDDVQYHPCAYVNVDGSGITKNPNQPIKLHYGDKRNVPVGTSVSMSYDTARWKGLFHYVDNTLVSMSPLTASPISPSSLQAGVHKLVLIDDNGILSEPSYFNATSATISHTVSGDQMTITYSSKDTAKYIQWTAGNNITELSGTGSDVVTIPSGMTQFRVGFESDFGTWFSEWTSIN